eukprot:13752934-Alexandrium_andersonii.AAC.1
MHDFRDLGGHLSTTRRYVGTTLTTRLRAAARVTADISRLPVPTQTRIQIARAKVLPAALFGGIAAPAAEGAM